MLIVNYRFCVHFSASLRPLDTTGRCTDLISRMVLVAALPSESNVSSAILCVRVTGHLFIAFALEPGYGQALMEA